MFCYYDVLTLMQFKFLLTNLRKLFTLNLLEWIKLPKGQPNFYKTESSDTMVPPNIFISDQDPQYVTEFLTSVCKQLGIKQIVSTAYHPEMDGQLEWTNEELETFLRLFINFH